ncbi:hypothetical protein OROMI_013008 [Orobanche minor]
MVFKISPSQEILKIRDGTPLDAEEILTYIKKPSKQIVWHFSSKLDFPSNILQKKRVARILFFKIWPSQEILKIRYGHLKKFSKFVMVPLRRRKKFWHTEKSPRNGSVWHFSSKLDVPSNVLQKKRVARILVFKIRPSQEINKIRDGTLLEAEEILTYRKKPRNGSVWHFSSKLDVPSNVLQKKRVAQILVFKIRPSQEILKIRDGTPSKVEEILTYRKSPRNGPVWYFSSNLDVPSNVLQKKRVARILVFKIRPSQEINKIRDGTPLEAEEILTYRKKPRNGSVWHFSSKLDVPSNVLQKKRVARILVFKIRPSQEILKIRDVARILVFKIRPSQEINKFRDGTPLEAEEILTYRKKPRNRSVWHFSSKLDVPSNALQKKRVAQILVFKLRPSQEILKILDGTPSEKKRVAQILVFKIRPSQEILKIRDGTPSEAEEILTYRKKPSKWMARIMVFKIRPSQEILKIRDGTPLDAEEILTYIKKPSKQIVWHFSSKSDFPSNILQKKRVTRILFFKIWPSQEILKIRYVKKRKKPRNGSVWHFSSKLDVPSNVLQKKRVARILVFKIRPSQEILKIRDGTPSKVEEILTYRKSPGNGSVWYFSSKLDVPSNVLQKKRVARILVFKIRPSQEINKIRDGTPLEAEEILTYRKKARNGSVWHFYSKLDVPSNVLQKKRVAQILVFKIRPSQEILKIRDGTPSEKKRVARILVFKIRPSQEINKIRDDTLLEAEEILTYRKGPEMDRFVARILKKRVARILVFKIRPSQEINKIRDGTPLEAEEILTHRKKPRNRSKKRVAQILVFKIRPSQEILKIRDGTPSE